MRDYAPLLAAAQPTRDRAAAMKLVCDLIWCHFGLEAGSVEPRRSSYSWIGFYEKQPGADEMILVQRRDKPACSPIGLHGMCGRGWQLRRPILISDVSTLGANYIACDPKDLSEIVIPLLNTDGACWGVLDGDSYELAAFDETDVRGLTALVECIGLSDPGHAAGTTLIL